MSRTIEQIKQQRQGFVLAIDLPEIIAENRLCPILVRCGNGRFTTPAQDVEWFIGLVCKSGLDYVHDVQFYNPVEKCSLDENKDCDRCATHGANLCIHFRNW